MEPRHHLFRLIALASFALVAGLLTTGCTEDKNPGFDCNCGPGQVCRNGACVSADAGGDAGDMGEDFVDNPDCPASGIVISELTYTPASGQPEWVELSGPADRDLTGFRLIGINGNGGTEFFNVALLGQLGSAGRFVIASATLSSADQTDAELVMQNGPDNLVLVDCVGQTVDAVGYGTFGATDVFRGEGGPAPTTSAGESLARCPGAPDTNDNAADFHVSTTPTPGANNDHFQDLFACSTCESGQFVGEVVINEVLVTDVEFIEILAQPNQSLLGLRVELVNGNGGEPYASLTLDATHTADADGFFLIGGAGADVDLPAALQNGPDSVRLMNCSEDVIDAVGYGNFGETDVFAGEGTAVPAPGTGHSLARCSDGADTDDNAFDFAEAVPTPRLTNGGFVDETACGASPCSPDVVINEVLPGTDGFVELRGQPNLGVDEVTIEVLNGDGTVVESVDAAGATNANGLISFDTDALAAAGGTVRLRDCDDATLDALAWGAGSGLQAEGTAAVAPGTDQGLARCPGEDLDSIDSDNNASDFHLVDTPSPGSTNSGFASPSECGLVDCNPESLVGAVIINEVVPDPDGGDAGNEWVELRGTPDLAIAGAELVHFNGNGGGELFRVTLPGSIPGDGIYVVGSTGDQAQLPAGGSGVLQNDNESLQLVCSGTVIDAVAWGTFDNIEDAKGEGAPTVEPGGGDSIARCATEALGDADSGDNATDFHLDQTPTRGAPNVGLGPACGEAECTPGTFDGVLTINEVLPGASGFVELLGTTSLPLGGVTITGYNGGGVAQFTEALEAADTTDANGFLSVDTATLAAGGGSVVITDCGGGVIDAVAWGAGADLKGEGDPAPAPTAAQSIGRCDGAPDTGDNSADFVLIESPTKGAANGIAGTEACSGPVPIAFYNFDTESAEPTSFATNVTVGAMTASDDRTVSFVAGNPGQAIRTTGWNVDNRYFEFVVTPGAGHQVTLTGLSFDQLRSSTGPPTWEVQVVAGDSPVSLGGGTDTPADSFVASSVAFEGAEQGPYDAAVSIRILGSGASSGAGAWRLDNVSLTGSVSP